MRPRDEGVFGKAAQKFQAWILVRETNPASLDFIDHRLYRPKPITCKPKTAKYNVNGKTLMGLVADPVRWPEAFGERVADALSEWTKFRTLHGLGEFRRQSTGGFTFEGARSSGSGYAINAEPTSSHEGCLTYEGKYLHGDYDLFDIVFPPTAPRTGVFRLPGQSGVIPVQGRSGVMPVLGRSGVIPTLGRPGVTETQVGPKYYARFRETDYRGERWEELSTFLNGQLGFELIQHGAQFDWKQDKFETVKAFGPKGENETWTAQQAESKYREWQRT